MADLYSDLEICYRDEHIICINKPVGMLSHRTSIDAHEKTNALAAFRDQINRYVYPVHRLDKPTSGLLLFALDKETAASLTEKFTQKTISKKYLGIVRGYTEDAFCIDYPLKKMYDKKDKHSTKESQPQEAITQIKTLARTELNYSTGKYPTSRFSLIEALPQTGRQRQIRRHLKHIFHPLVGDTAHGDGKQNRLFREKFDCHRLLLHARILQFQHPQTKKDITITAKLDKGFSTLIQQVFSIELI